MIHFKELFVIVILMITGVIVNAQCDTVVMTSPTHQDLSHIEIYLQMDNLVVQHKIDDFDDGYNSVVLDLSLFYPDWELVGYRVKAGQASVYYPVTGPEPIPNSYEESQASDAFANAVLTDYEDYECVVTPIQDKRIYLELVGDEIIVSWVSENLTGGETYDIYHAHGNAIFAYSHTVDKSPASVPSIPGIHYFYVVERLGNFQTDRSEYAVIVVEGTIDEVVYNSKFQRVSSTNTPGMYYKLVNGKFEKFVVLW